MRCWFQKQSDQSLSTEMRQIFRLIRVTASLLLSTSNLANQNVLWIRLYHMGTELYHILRHQKGKTRSCKLKCKISNYFWKRCSWINRKKSKIYVVITLCNMKFDLRFNKSFLMYFWLLSTNLGVEYFYHVRILRNAIKVAKNYNFGIFR